MALPVALVMAARGLLRSRRFALFCVLTLGLSVGAGTAIYSVIHATLFRTVALPNLDQLVNLYHTNPRERGGLPAISFSKPDFDDLASQQQAFDRIAGYAPFQLPVIARDTALLTRGEVVTADYFAVVGAQPIAGRVLVRDEKRSMSSNVAVISDRLQRRLFADSEPIGAVLKLRGYPFEVVGVVASSGLAGGGLIPTDIWLPESAAATLLDRDFRDRSERWLLALAVRKRSVSRAQVDAEVSRVAKSLDTSHPLDEGRLPNGFRASRDWIAIPTSEIRFNGQDTRFFRPLADAIVGATLIVLFVACTNLTNLILTRQFSRRSETAIKTALGASRRQLVAEKLLEGCLLAAVGGVVAIAVAALLIALLQTELGIGNDVVVRFQPRLEPAVFGAGALGTALSLLIVSVVPAYRAAQLRPFSPLQAESSHSSTVRWTGRRGLVILQVAASVLFLSMAAQIAKRVAQAQREQLDTLERLAVVRLATTGDPVDGRRAIDILAGLRAGALGLAGAPLAIATGLPGVAGGAPAQLVRGGADAAAPLRVEVFTATTDIFSTLGLHAVQGRTWHEHASGPFECVLSQRAAAHAFGTTHALGRNISLREADTRVDKECVVVGIVQDTGPKRQAIIGQAYVPFAEDPRGELTVLARVSDPERVAGAIASTVSTLDREIAPVFFGSGSDAAGPQTAMMRVATGLASLLGLLSLALALFGLYGVMSQLVIARTREIGLRLALGSSASQVRTLMLRQGFEPVLIGAAVGLALAAASLVIVGRVSGPQSQGTDLFAFFAVPVPILIVCLVACLLPVRRVTSISPGVTLRTY